MLNKHWGLSQFSFHVFTVFREVDVSNSGAKEIVQFMNKQLFRANVFVIRVIILIVSFNMFKKIGQPVISVSTINECRIFQSTDYVQDIVLNLFIGIIILTSNDYLNEMKNMCQEHTHVM